MAKVTIGLAVALIALGLVGFIGTGSQHYTALIPTWIGLILGLFGALSFSPDAGRRKLFMHINVTVALLGFIGTTVELFRSLFKMAASGAKPDPWAIDTKLALEFILLAYFIVCVQSFIAARKARLV